MVVVSLATVASRVGGLLRDIVIFALLGLSTWSGLFLFAFTVPNLFRRLLGEGALTSAMVPLFSEAWERHSPREAFIFLNRLLSRLSAVLLGSIGLFSGIFLLGANFLGPHWRRALGLSLLLTPYLLFSCLSAAVSGALNVLGSFGLPALTALFLNVAMVIAGIFALVFCPSDGMLATAVLCLGVLGGGAIQFVFPCYLLHRRGWKFRWDWGRNALLLRLWNLFVPAVLGAAMVQINLTLSRLLAFGLTDTGMATLYLSNRLVELPLGIFAVAILSVTFPGLSRFAAAGELHSFATGYRRAHWSLLMLTVPASIGLLFLGRPILSVLFAWGNYSAADLARTVPVLAVASVGIPFFAAIALAIRTFHAHQDMGTPLRVAVLGIAANLLLTLLLVRRLGAAGIAAANVLAAIFQWILLRKKLPKLLGHSPFPCRKFWSLCAANGFLVLFLASIAQFFRTPSTPRLDSLLHLAVAILPSICGYAAILRFLDFGEVGLFFAFLRPFRKRMR